MTRWRRFSRFGNWQTVAWVALGVVAGAVRLVGLGNRPLSFDEGVHAFYSWRLAELGAYFHTPVTHGPVLFYLDALVFLFAGASDFSARLMPALAGLGLVLLPLLFRRWLGPAVPLAVGVLLAFSPLVLFYSRYLRNDIYFGLLCTVWIWAVFRYFERRSPADLYLLTIVSSLAVATKEIAFIFAATLTLWLAAKAVHRRPGRVRAADLTMLHGTLFLPFAVPLSLAVTAPPLFDSVRAVPAAAAVAVALGGALAAGLAFLWSRLGVPGSTLPFPFWVRLAALGWGIEAVYFSTFLKNPAGLVTGFFGSVAYWLTQQPVSRGGQPWFYYPLLLILYEFFPLLLALVSVVFRLRLRLARRETGRLRRVPPLGDRFREFCLYWAGASLVAYTLAGEKMPWLAVHLVLPLVWLSGDGLCRLLALLRRPGFLHVGLPTLSLRLASVLIVVSGATLWLRAGWMLNFVHPESPSELAVYAHGDPEIGSLIERFESFAPSAGVRVMRDVAWPARWYLRRQGDVAEVNSLEEALHDRPRFILTRAPLTPEERQLLPQGSALREYPYLCWPDEGYKRITVEALLGKPLNWPSLNSYWKAFSNRDFRGVPGFLGPSRQEVTLVELPSAKVASSDRADEDGP
ncbi:MAG: flippase activity-associated protein Agl23 [Acidobacteriota bacterium]